MSLTSPCDEAHAKIVADLRPVGYEWNWCPYCGTPANIIKQRDTGRQESAEIRGGQVKCAICGEPATNWHQDFREVGHEGPWAKIEPVPDSQAYYCDAHRPARQP